jgi:hypothetical protein
MLESILYMLICPPLPVSLFLPSHESRCMPTGPQHIANIFLTRPNENCTALPASS